MNNNKLTIAMLSLHSSPIGPLGTQDTGGMSVYVRELARWLGAGGHRVEIFTCAGGGPPEIQLYPKVRLIQLGKDLGASPPKVALPAMLPQVFDALDTYRRTHAYAYDLVHSHYWLSGVVGLMAQAQWKCPHVTMFHTLAARKNRDSALENEPDLRLANERRLAAQADRIIVPVQGEQDFLESAYQAPRSRISVIPGGINLGLFKPLDRRTARRRLNLPDNAALVLFVGRFAPLKRVDRLVSAVARLRSTGTDLQLMIVGGDDFGAESTQALERTVQRLHLADGVHFAGRVEQEALPVHYSAADLLVLPSDYESFGLVLLEAMACGTPVAATRVGIAPALVEEGVNGTLLEGNDIPCLVKGIERMIQGGCVSAERIRAAVLPYGWENVAAAVADVYVGLLKNSPPAPATHPGPIGLAATALRGTRGAGGEPMR
jgi:D-inositol-3-phosphate glycosyltransferase